MTKRRRKLALLAVLAMTRRPLTRDQLVEMFWGDQEEARARHSLSDALSHLRRVLGREAIATRQAEITLGDEVELSVDAAELAAAVSAADWARAASLYGGPFLDGVHVASSPNFDQFVARERHRLETLFLQACDKQCLALARSRQWDECGMLASKWLDAAPLSTDAALYRLNALKSPGTRDADQRALDEFERLAARLQADYGRKPDRAVVALARDVAERLLRTDATGEFRIPKSVEVPEPRTTPQSTPIVTSATTTATITATVPTATASAEVPAPLAQPDEPEPDVFITTTAPAARKRRRVRHIAFGALAGGGVVAALMAIVMLVHGRLAARSAPTATKPAIAIAEIRSLRNDTASAWLADGLDQMIAAKLSRTSDVEVIAPERVRDAEPKSSSGERSPLSADEVRDIGRQVGASWVVSGTIARGDSGQVLTLSVRDVESGKLLRMYTVVAPNMIAAAEQAAVHLLTLAGASGPGPRLADVETSNLDAYDHFARFVAAQHEGRVQDQARELDAAIALDSSFVSAVRERINVAVFLNDQRTIDQLTNVFHRYGNRATAWDRMVIALQAAFHNGERARSEELARDLVSRYPRDSRAYQWLENIYEHHGKWAEAEQAAQQQLALDSLGTLAGRGVCVPCLALGNISGVRLKRGDIPGAIQAMRRLIELEPDLAGPWLSMAELLSAERHDDEAIQAARRAVALSAGDPDAQAGYARSLLKARRYESADSLITQWLAGPSQPLRRQAFDLRFTLQRERGQFRASTATIHQMLAAFPDEHELQLVEANNLGRIGDYAGAQRLYEALNHQILRRTITDVPDAATLTGDMARAFCWNHALEADAIAPGGDTVRLHALADSIELTSARSYYGRDWVLHHFVLGLIAEQGRRWSEAEREFAASQFSAFGWTRTLTEQAKAKLQLGKPLDAIPILRRAYYAPLDAMGRYEPRTQIDYWMARAFGAAGQRDSAAVYAGYVKRAWKDGDPEVKRLLVGMN